MAETSFVPWSESAGATPSLFGNNLTSSGGITAFASRGKVRMVNNSHNQAFDGPSAAVITYLQYIQLFTNEWILCIGSNVGSQIYNEDGSFLLHLLPADEQTQALTRMQCHRACCSMEASADERQLLCFGDYQGKVEVVEYRAGAGFSTISPAIEGFGPGITCMGSCKSSGEVICGYDDGSVLWWSVKPSPTGEGIVYDQVHSDRFEDCPVGIASTGLSLSIAFGSGRIRVFTGKMRLAEIAAHARWITGITSLPRLNMVATVAEDTVLNVWEVSEELGVNLVHTAVVADKQLTGVAFSQGSNDGACELAVVAYDCGWVGAWSSEFYCSSMGIDFWKKCLNPVSPILLRNEFSSAHSKRHAADQLYKFKNYS